MLKTEIRVPCKICGKEFTKSTANQLYCSEECQTIARHEKQRIADKKRKEQRGSSKPKKFTRIEAHNKKFDLNVGDIVIADDNRRDAKEIKSRKYRVTKIYKHFFEVEDVLNGAIRHYTKGARICNEVQKNQF